MNKIKTDTWIVFDESKVENNIDALATKEDVYACKFDFKKLENKIDETKSDVIKWLFNFFFALALMILGFYFRK